MVGMGKFELPPLAPLATPQSAPDFAYSYEWAYSKNAPERFKECSPCARSRRVCMSGTSHQSCASDVTQITVQRCYSNDARPMLI